MKFIYKIIYVSLIRTYYEINCEQNSKNGLHYYFNIYILIHQMNMIII